MSRGFLQIFQVLFKQEQASELDYTPRMNSNCSVYFENDVIVDIVGKDFRKDFEYLGVVSHKLREKVNTCRRGPRINLKRFDKDLFLRRLEETRPEVMGFLQYSPHDPVRYFETIHPKLQVFFHRVMREIAYNWKPTILDHVFYGNHFVTTPEIYLMYVNEMLIPAMEVMDGMPELMENSGYPAELPKDLQTKWKIKHYPYHAFVCERMFSWWCFSQKLDVQYY